MQLRYVKVETLLYSTIKCNFKCNPLFPSDHPIHAPAKSDPFAMDLPDPITCELRMVDGVVHVYEDEEKAAKNEPIELAYPDRATFLADSNKLLALIANGPM